MYSDLKKKKKNLKKRPINISIINVIIWLLFPVTLDEKYLENKRRQVPQWLGIALTPIGIKGENRWWKLENQTFEWVGGWYILTIQIVRPLRVSNYFASFVLFQK